MKSNLLIIILSSFVFIGCKTSEKPNLDYFDATFLDENSSKNSSNWEGMYFGVMPCENCKSIDVELVIKKDLSYVKRTKRIGENNNFITEEGVFSWDELGNSILVNGISYIVGKDMLVQDTDAIGVSKEGLELSKNVLYKNVIDVELTNSKWELIELIGTTIENRNTKMPYFTLSANENTFKGNSGCNSFLGNYRIYTKNRIIFSNIVITQDLCFNAPFEGSLLRSLETIDHYIIKNDTLSFNTENSTPMVKFICVEN